EGRHQVLAPARKAKRRREHSHRIEAEAARPLALGGGPSAPNFLACRSAAARYARRSRTAGQEAPPLHRKAGVINYENNQRIHIQTTCKGRARQPASFYQLSTARPPWVGIQ